MDMVDDSARFAFSPPSSPFIPFDFTKSPSLRPESKTRRLTPPSPHKIKRKPVPVDEEWALEAEEARSRFDLPQSQTVPRPPHQRVYIHERGAKSTPMFTSTPIKPPAESPPPLPTAKSANAVQTVLQTFKAFSTNYRYRPLRKMEASSSLTSISTGESQDLQTPRESYEDFTNIPVKRQERSMEVTPLQTTAPKNGYTTRAQREAQLAGEEVGEKKKKSFRFPKMFAVQ